MRASYVITYLVELGVHIEQSLDFCIDTRVSDVPCLRTRKVYKVEMCNDYWEKVKSLVNVLPLSLPIIPFQSSGLFVKFKQRIAFASRRHS